MGMWTDTGRGIAYRYRHGRRSADEDDGGYRYRYVDFVENQVFFKILAFFAKIVSCQDSNPPV